MRAYIYRSLEKEEPAHCHAMTYDLRIAVMQGCCSPAVALSFALSLTLRHPTPAVSHLLTAAINQLVLALVAFHPPSARFFLSLSLSSFLSLSLSLSPLCFSLSLPPVDHEQSVDEQSVERRETD